MVNLEININVNWTFKEIVNNLKALRDNYEDTLRFFSYLDLHKHVEFERNVRDAIYSLEFEEWKKDRIWDYMNHHEFYYVIKGIVKREEEKKKRWHKQ